MVEKKERLEKRFKEMELSSENIERGFNTIPTEDVWEYDSPWSEFIDGTKIHLGKDLVDGNFYGILIMINIIKIKNHYWSLSEVVELLMNIVKNWMSKNLSRCH